MMVPLKLKRSQKRILIVPDYLTPYDMAMELYSILTRMGYDVAVFAHSDSLYESRQELERHCRIKRFDLLVTLDTGCLLAARVTNCPRVFVNPDWTLGEWMKENLGKNCQITRDDMEMALEMADPAYIECSDKPTYGWFSLCALESHMTEEHLKHFNTATSIHDFYDLSVGLPVIARQIDDLFED